MMYLRWLFCKPQEAVIESTQSYLRTVSHYDEPCVPGALKGSGVFLDCRVLNHILSDASD